MLEVSLCSSMGASKGLARVLTPLLRRFLALRNLSTVSAAVSDMPEMKLLCFWPMGRRLAGDYKADARRAVGVDLPDTLRELIGLDKAFDGFRAFSRSLVKRCAAE
jgi:hypothetical protein